jgi:hypothetical protein
MAAHFTHGDRITLNQATRRPPSLLLPHLGIESQREVEIKLSELHQPGAARACWTRGLNCSYEVLASRWLNSPPCQAG